MSQAELSPPEASCRPAGAAVDSDLAFLRRFAGPLVLLARAMLAYIFLSDGWYQIKHYAEVGDYMRENGVASALLPLVILTQLGGGTLVFVGLKTRWAAIALMGFCLLAALFFHMSADQTNDFNKNIAIAGGFLALAMFGPGPWSIDQLARPTAPVRRSKSERTDMSEDVSRRKALSLLGVALGLALALTADEAWAETARRPRRRQPRAGQPAAAPADAATTEVKPTKSISNLEMETTGPRVPLHIGE
jgi:putative oxidoreductase